MGPHRSHRSPAKDTRALRRADLEDAGRARSRQRVPFAGEPVRGRSDAVLRHTQRADVPLRVWRGAPYPLGATWDGSGVNFALFSENAEAVDLCLFDADGTEQPVRMTEQTDLVWHC